jgi:type II secretion system protein G
MVYTSGMKPRLPAFVLILTGILAAPSLALTTATVHLPMPPRQVQAGVFPRSPQPSAARPVAAGASLSGLMNAVSMFRLDTGRMPRANEGLDALIRRPADLTNWRGPYISVTNRANPLSDPWGNSYRLIDTTPPGARPSFTIKSNGPDGLPDTPDDLSISG